jgi:hypothetical protein
LKIEEEGRFLEAVDQALDFFEAQEPLLDLDLSSHSKTRLSSGNVPHISRKYRAITRGMFYIKLTS